MIRTMCSEIHKFIIFIWNKEESPVELKKSITVPIYKKGYKTDCRNYKGISLLSTTYKILCNIPLWSLTPYAQEITGDNQDRFQMQKVNYWSYILHS